MRNEEKATLILENACFDETLGKTVIPDTPWTPCDSFTNREIRNMIFHSTLEMAQWKDELIQKFKHHADAMYSAMQNLSTDTSPIRKAMEDYHNFLFTDFYND